MLEFSRDLQEQCAEMVDFLAFFLPRAKKERGKRRFFVDFPFFGNGENVKFSGKGGGGERERNGERECLSRFSWFKARGGWRERQQK